MQNLNTKAGREAAKLAYIQRNGCELQYAGNGIEIYTFIPKYRPSITALVAFRGNASKPYVEQGYANGDRLNAKIEALKRDAARLSEWQAEQKAKYKGHKSNHAAAAAHAKAYLSGLFPGVKFTASSDSYAGGDSIRVYWLDGPSSERVNSLLARYQYGSFDGMTDMYSVDNRREDVPQVKYAFGQRSKSDALTEFAQKFVAATFGESAEQVHRITCGDLLPGSLDYRIDRTEFTKVVNGTPEQYAAYYAAADAELRGTDSADDRDDQPAITFSVSALFAPAASAAPSCDVPAGAR